MRAILARPMAVALAALAVWSPGVKAADEPLEPFGPDWSITENQPCQVWNYGWGDDMGPFNWSGACVDGKASGEGRLTYLGGDGVFEGTMRAGKMHGYGTVTLSGSFRYEGGLRDAARKGDHDLRQRRPLRRRVSRRPVPRARSPVFHRWDRHHLRMARRRARDRFLHNRVGRVRHCRTRDRPRLRPAVPAAHIACPRARGRATRRLRPPAP